MSTSLPDCRWEIQIKQRAGKWVLWCYCATESDMRASWGAIDSLRRKARLKQDGEVIAKYEPPAHARRATP